MKPVINTVRACGDAIVSKALLAYGLAALNIGGFFIGTAFWYGDFIRASNPPLWATPFIPDSPLSTLLFGIALILLHHRKPSDLLNRFAIAYNIKFGTWTLLFWSLYWARTGDFNPVSLLMFATHLGMVIEGQVLYLYLHQASFSNTFIVLAWFVLHDIVDYAPIAPGRDGYGWYPPLPLGIALVPAMMTHAVLMTWVLGWSLLLHSLLWHKRVGHNVARLPK